MFPVILTLPGLRSLRPEEMSCPPFRPWKVQEICLRFPESPNLPSLPSLRPQVTSCLRCPEQSLRTILTVFLLYPEQSQ